MNNAKLLSMSKKLGATALIAAVAFGGLVSAQTASAAEMPPGYTMTITPTTGKTDGSHLPYGNTMLESLDISTGCPVGFQTSGNLLFAQNQGGTWVYANMSQVRSNLNTNQGNHGLDGSPISESNFITTPLANNLLTNKPWPTAVTIQPGSFEMRVYCRASSTSSDNVTDKWFSLPMQLSADSTTWSVDVPKTATTVALSGVTNSDKTVSLTATVKDASTLATATAATGDITFSNGAVVPVVNGIATTTTAVQAVGAYSFTAAYAGDTTYAAATSGAFSGVIAGANEVVSNITVTIPTTGALVLTGQANPNVDLGTAALNGANLEASGVLPSLQVSDTRNVNAPAWALTGIVGDFTAGALTIDGKALGWTPRLVGTPNAGVAGAVVAPQTANPGNLKSSKALATGSVVNGTPLTTVDALLGFQVPANTASGNYSAVLTLTLI